MVAGKLDSIGGEVGIVGRKLDSIGGKVGDRRQGTVLSPRTAGLAFALFRGQ
jgi:hypothetical protein